MHRARRCVLGQGEHRFAFPQSFRMRSRAMVNLA
jgi:hypothetical protein